MKAVRKDFYVEIKKSFSRFISILLIVALGVSFYAGIRSSEPDMRLTGDRLYDESNLLDIKVISTMGLSKADVDAVTGIDGIEKAIGSYSSDVIAQTGKNENVIKFMSITEGINDLVITSGDMPVKDNECMIDKTFMEQEKLKLGDKVTVKSAGHTEVDALLKEKEYKIVGVFTSTQYMSSSNKGTSTVGNGRVAGLAAVKENVFKLESFTELYAVVDGAKELECYSDKYKDKVEDVITAIKDQVMDTQIKIKYEELYGQATDAILEIEGRIKETQDAVTLSENGIKKAKKAIKKAKSQKDAVQDQIDQNQQQIDIYNKFIEQYSSMGFVPKGILNTYDVPMEQLEREREQFIQAKAPFDAIVKQCDEVIRQAREGIKTAGEAIEEANKGLEELDFHLADANEARDDLKSPTWYITDRNYIQTYVEYNDDAQRLGNIGLVFPVIFFLVATLVSLTTMTRMIAEQRTQIGTMKALGYSKFTIAMKYIKYAMFATITGSLLGSLIGSKLFPAIILRAYRVLYPSLNNVQTPFNWQHSVTATVIAIICVLAATIFASYNTLSQTASQLMRPEVPKAGKRILLERVPFIWKHLNFNMKSTIRNLVRYKKRFFMTLFGVSGCMALIVVGFGLRDSTTEITNLQYGSLHKYNAAVTFNLSSSEKRIKQANDFIDEDDRISDYLRISETTIEISGDEKIISGSLIVPKEEAELKDYISLRERKGKKELNIKKGEVIISEKLASLLEVEAGDSIKLTSGEYRDKEVKISGITENYLMHYVYMSPELYEDTFTQEPIYNELLLRTASDKEVDESKLAEKLLEFKAINSVSFTNTLQSYFLDVMRSIDIIVAVLVISAGGLAFIVLYNLNNINITERKRELATLKVLGFFNREVTGYVYRENIIITVLGILAGCGLGAILHMFVIRTAEIDMIMFSRDIFLRSYLYSGLITIVFSALINFTMYFKLKKIDMAASMKTIE